MHYETLLFTRNQRQDFTALIRPALMTNKEVSAIGGIFNYVTDVSRLTTGFPSLYYFPLGEYLFLLRHYDSGRRHAGRAIGVIEGAAVKQADAAEFAPAVFVEQQADLLNVTAEVSDIEAQDQAASTEHDWNGSAPHEANEPFGAEFLKRREQDRLFLPFNAEGRAMLITLLADRRFPQPPYFAFGTNSDVLAQLERYARIDAASFFKTERPSFRSRATNRVTGTIGGADETVSQSSTALRPVAGNEMRLRPETKAAAHEDTEADQETLVGDDAVSIRPFMKQKPTRPPRRAPADDTEATVLTMRQMRDRLRAAEAPSEPEAQPTHDPIHWLLHLFSSLIKPR